MIEEIKRFGLDAQKIFKILLNLIKNLKMVLKIETPNRSDISKQRYSVWIFVKNCDWSELSFSKMNSNNSKLKGKNKVRCYNRVVCRQPKGSEYTYSLRVLFS